MTDCRQEVFEFQGVGSQKVTADFRGGYLSSDGGGLLLRELERRRGIIRKLSGCFTDHRDRRYVEHGLAELLAQRVFSLALGYEDLNDHDRLRLDPLQALLAGKKDVLGEHRRDSKDKGKALAGRCTLNRLELGAEGTDGRYQKIEADLQKIEALLIEEGVKAIRRRIRELVLDFDATDDPLHGQQEGAYFHGYYRGYCYLPLYCFCGNIPLWARLRDCKRDASDGTVAALEKIVPALRRRFGKRLRIIVRADGGFAREEIMAWCEENDVGYCFGFARNDRVTAELEPLFAQLEEELQTGKTELPCRAFKEFTYRTKKSWSRPRRVIGKAEILAKGRNPRFIVTNLSAEEEPERFAAAALYEKFYCARGDMENRIKEQQLDLFADRTSTRSIASNQLRLWFSTFAHLLLSILQDRALQGTELEKATVGQIRLKLFKIAARITVSCRRIHFELASAYPHRPLFQRACRRLAQLEPV